jgi:hypothetical protein
VENAQEMLTTTIIIIIIITGYGPWASYSNSLVLPVLIHKNLSLPQGVIVRIK